MPDSITSGNEPFPDARTMMNGVSQSVDKFLDTAQVKAVYGQEVRNGDTIVIPSAEILAILGVGSGGGGGRNGDENVGGGSGAGGGGRILSRPVAALVITPDYVRVEPIVDITKIWMAALTAAGFMVAMLARMRRPRGSRS